MAINKINSKSIEDLDLSADDLAPGTITGAKIAPATVESSNIAPGTIANDRLANTGITINGTSIALGASGEIVAGTDWQAVTVADGSTTVNTVAGGGYLLDTNAGVIEAFLPTSPSRGDTVVIADYSGTFATNRVIVNTGGANIDSTATGDVQLTTNNTIAEFIYIDSSKGWLVKLNQAAGTTPSSALTEGNVYDVDPNFVSATGGTVTTSGDFKIHTFTGDGCFVQTAGSGPIGFIDYLVVAGGGGGGNGASYAGAGGAGGFRLSNSYGLPAPTMSPLANPTGLSLTPGTYPVTVGGGGAAGSCTNGVNGNNSVLATITSAGGGGGGYNQNNGSNGGSGGGGGGGNPNPIYPGCGKGGGLGNTPPVSPPQGNTGGDGNPGPQAPTGGEGGGGGGAGAVGGNAGPSDAGDGGVGSFLSPSFAVSCAGTSGPVCGVRYFAGGGGGGSDSVGGPTGSGGSGGGGRGAPSALAGSSNTGGGGGGASHNGNPPTPGTAGGSGIVIIRYKFQ